MSNELKYRAKYSFRQLNIIAWIFLLPIPFILLHRKYDKIGVTENGVMYDKSLISKNVNILPFKKIESIYYNATLLDRLFKSGTVIVSCGDGNSIRFNNVKNPQEFVDTVNKNL